jgi:peptide/nickel transport system permease protein
VQPSAGAGRPTLRGPARPAPPAWWALGGLQRLLARRWLRHLGRALAVAFAVMCIAFALIRLIPGDPVLLLLGDRATPEAVSEYRALLGLNGSLPEQFLTYVAHLARGDLGRSLVTRLTVTSVIARTLPVTLWLIAVALVIGAALAVPLALAAALWRWTWFGQAFRVVSSVLLATPVFLSGLVAILFFSILLGLAPVAGYDPSFPANLRYLWLPALVVCGVLVPVFARVLQSSIVDTLQQEFVESAIVRGLPRRIFVWRYLLRPSLAPTIGLLGYVVGQLLGAAVVVEIIFGLPGIGTELINGVLGRDYTLVQGIVFVFGLIVVAVSYLSDVLSGLVDPRTRTT